MVLRAIKEFIPHSKKDKYTKHDVGTIRIMIKLKDECYRVILRLYKLFSVKWTISSILDRFFIQFPYHMQLIRAKLYLEVDVCVYISDRFSIEILPIMR